jgi:hypothetical protein
VDDLGFDRLAKRLAASSGRRQAVLASLSGLFAATVASGADEADAKKKKKRKKPFCLNGQTVEVKGKKAKRRLLQQGATAGECPVVPPAPPPPPPPACKNLTESCTATSQCCNASSGAATCRAHVKDECEAQFSGQRCCALEGVLCNPNKGNCECCDDLACGEAGDGKFRCEAAEP